MQVAIQVFVKMPSGKTLQIDVDPTTNTCFDLKEKITACLIANKDKSYLPNQQILSFSSMFSPLDDSLILLWLTPFC